MRWCLVPEWASELSLDEAAAFLGPFDFVYETQVRKEEQIVLLLAAKLFEDAFVLHDFRCTFEQGRMANIETDWGCGQRAPVLQYSEIKEATV